MAFGTGTINSFGGAVNDLFQSKATADGLRLKARGARVEGENYDLAATLAKQNEDFTKLSTSIKQTQTDREIYMGLGAARNDVAGAGFTGGGSAIDIMRSSAQQGALQKQVLGEQGLITEAGYNEQNKAYTNLAGFARYSAEVQDKMANDAETAGKWSAGFKIAGGIASIFTGGAAGGDGLSSMGANAGL